MIHEEWFINSKKILVRPSQAYWAWKSFKISWRLWKESRCFTGSSWWSLEKNSISNNILFNKKNTAFLRFTVLLAVAYQCGLEIGNINHSKHFPARLLPLLDGVLLKDTAEWFRNQDKVTLLLDGGTVFGLVMLVVYFFGRNGSVRLAGCQLCESKHVISLLDCVTEFDFRTCLFLTIH